MSDNLLQLLLDKSVAELAHGLLVVHVTALVVWVGDWGDCINLSSPQVVHLIFLGIKLVEGEPETNTSDEGKDSNNTVVPDQKWIIGESDQSLEDGRRNGVHEEGDGGDQRTHILWCLREGVLEGGDGGHNL